MGEHQANENQTFENEVIEDEAQLVAYLEAGAKPKADWRIGTEHEKFAYHLEDLSPLAYDGAAGIGAILRGLTRFGWQPITEAGNIIALKQNGASVTLEPGGQLELSGAPLETVHETCSEVHTHLAQVKEIGEALGVGFLGLGYHPFLNVDDAPMMPKARYRIMRDYMPTRGALGRDMMFLSCTVQVNLDFSSEADMVKKFRTALALQPVATALFANSPFRQGTPNGFASYRSHIWTDTDPDRTGMLPFVFEAGMGYERWADYVLDAPMYFVARQDRLIDAAGQSFRDFLAGRLPALPGEKPTLKDWEDHLTTVFPEVRLKHFLEMRGADGGPWSRLCALPALWVGLLYDQSALDAAWDLAKDWTLEEHEVLRAEVPKTGLKTEFRGETVRDLAGRVLDIATAGLDARARLNTGGETEAGFLSALHDAVDTGHAPADDLLARYHGPWAGDVRKVFEEFSY